MKLFRMFPLLNTKKCRDSLRSNLAWSKFACRVDCKQSAVPVVGLQVPHQSDVARSTCIIKSKNLIYPSRKRGECFAEATYQGIDKCIYPVDLYLLVTVHPGHCPQSTPVL